MILFVQDTIKENLAVYLNVLPFYLKIIIQASAKQMLTIRKNSFVMFQF